MLPAPLAILVTLGVKYLFSPSSNNSLYFHYTHYSLVQLNLFSMGCTAKLSHVTVPDTAPFQPTTWGVNLQTTLFYFFSDMVFLWGVGDLLNGHVSSAYSYFSGQSVNSLPSFNIFLFQRFGLSFCKPQYSPALAASVLLSVDDAVSAAEVITPGDLSWNLNIWSTLSQVMKLCKVKRCNF